MSIEKWKQEFYHRAPSKRMTTLEAVDHSLLKWEGLLPKNLKKHKVTLDRDNYEVLDKADEAVTLGHETCALCTKFYRNSHTAGIDGQCDRCPLVLSGHLSCLDDNSAYAQVFTQGAHAKIMEQQLRETLVWVLEKS